VFYSQLYHILLTLNASYSKLTFLLKTIARNEIALEIRSGPR